jgi:MFS family permease
MTAAPHVLKPLPSAVTVFAVFALAYLLSAALRSVNAVIAPELVRDFSLSASELGFLSAMYFLGFTATQWPLGHWLDRFGPRKVESILLCVAVLGCLVFAQASTFTELSIGRLLFGIGVSACLMAPYTGFRHWFDPALNARLSTWMLTTGSVGMIVSSAPVQWAVPVIGWRGVFWAALAALLLAIALIWRYSPAVPKPQVSAASASNTALSQSYAAVFRHAYFRSMVPFLVLMYGGLLAVQTLWVGPWLTQVTGYSAAQAAWSILVVHAAMGSAFLAWGLALPRLLSRGYTASTLIRNLLPLGLALWALVIALGAQAGAWAWVLWAVAFAGISVTSMSQITLSQYFVPQLAGRVNTAANLLIFGGAFALQWLVGVCIDAFGAAGLSRVASFQAAFALLLALMAASYLWFIARVPRMPKQ